MKDLSIVKKYKTLKGAKIAQAQFKRHYCGVALSVIFKSVTHDKRYKIKERYTFIIN